MKAQFGFVMAPSVLTRRHSAAVFWHGLLGRIRRWRELARQREQLASLSDAALKDIGLSRADILQEAEKPFWIDHLRR
ncbi:Uncharacterized conserved protein YjiS, DUF1127 family [Pseudomonas delhiensis]|uniref:Uncharacterized conserved protein YjiS, DUF1127 family n=1 Tax=Pseudomonas delhiensis TaxID=366289 RepID=A0A239J5L4_9PSED|nr:DUF1127 domain-containing protein [Pseudomonas delhiensis]SDJ74586.1 Uncharacterized conserved protein YjiS, DUF1127 family [Pseudomonas delhiensis]SNS99944.1 Uncharacterized conserved protein YjiS, DUF1127 family [Pseudomonas delhiensis]